MRTILIEVKTVTSVQTSCHVKQRSSRNWWKQLLRSRFGRRARANDTFPTQRPAAAELAIRFERFPFDRSNLITFTEFGSRARSRNRSRVTQIKVVYIASK